MNTTRLAAVLMGGMSLAVLGGCNESEAQVAQADSARHPHEVCTDQTVTREKPVKDKNRILGTVAGALVGGVIGDKVGGKGNRR